MNAAGKLSNRDKALLRWLDLQGEQGGCLADAPKGVGKETLYWLRHDGLVTFHGDLETGRNWLKCGTYMRPMSVEWRLGAAAVRRREEDELRLRRMERKTSEPDRATFLAEVI